MATAILTLTGCSSDDNELTVPQLQDKTALLELRLIGNGINTKATGDNLPTQAHLLAQPEVKRVSVTFGSTPLRYYLASTSVGPKPNFANLLVLLKGYVSQMKYLFSKEGAKQLGGFGTIGSIFPATWDWYQFWYMTAFLSIILAFMNILPIPALDGGHVLFLIYEIVARRKPSDKFMERAQMVGMFLLFGLLIWANFNDVLRFFF